MISLSPTLEDLLATAVARHRRGELDAAAEFYDRALKHDPAHQGVLHSLGVLQTQRGRFDEAAAWLRRAMGAGPPTAALWSDYGIALEGLGDGDGALEAHRRAHALSPANVQAANNLGEALRKLGRAEEAVPLLEAAFAAEPALVEVRANLAHALAALERDEEAVAHYQAVVAAEPSHLEALRGLGRALMRLDRASEALGPLEAVAAAAPQDAQARIDLGRAFASLDRDEAAARAFAEAVALAPERPAAHLGLGQALIQLESAAEAIESLDRALALDPKLAEAHHSRGNALETLGRIEAATLAFETAVAIAPDRPMFHYDLAETRRFTPGDPRLAAIEALAERMDSFDEPARITLHYALAKAYDDLGRHGRAFRHLSTGAAMKRATLEYKEAATFAMFRRIAKVFDTKLFADKAGLGDPSATPVFIVGMPRSGTTLIEQVLASHPRVHGAGELGHMRRLARAMTFEDGRRAFPDIVPSLDGDTLRALGAQYLASVTPLAPEALRITDKLPENFPYAGLIHLMLPNAKIVLARRDPADICLSCYSKLFAGHQPHTYDLAELGRYYRHFDALMRHWRAVLPPGVLLEVQYEELVADFEPQARRLLAHCGLEWDPRCLDFHRTERPVRTASVTQVRRPLYSSSVGRWRPYRRLLAPLFSALQEGS